MNSLISRVDHLVIAVDDLQGATDDYALLLGREPSWRGAHPLTGTTNTLFRLDNTYVELLAGVGAGSEGLIAMSLGTDDIEASRDALSGLASPPVEGTGKDVRTSAMRRWKTATCDPSQTRGVAMFLIEHLSPPDALPPALPAADAPVVAVDHVVVMTSDADAAIALYRDRLGFDLRLDRSFDDLGARLCFFRVGDLILEVAQHGRTTSEGLDRLWGISYRVPDIEAAHARCRQAGITVSDVRIGRRPGTKVFTVKSHTHEVATLFLAKD